MTRDDVLAEQLIRKNGDEERHHRMPEQYQGEELAPGDSKKVADRRAGGCWIPEPEDLGDERLVQPEHHPEEVQLAKRCAVRTDRDIEKEQAMSEVQGERQQKTPDGEKPQGRRPGEHLREQHRKHPEKKDRQGFLHPG